MSIRDEITAGMKEAMKAGDSARLSAIRLIMAKLKDADIAARILLDTLVNPQA